MTKTIRPAARAIVINDGKLLAIRRTKNGRKYTVTPGGRIEDGETPEEAVMREVTEETTVVIANPRLVFVEEPNDGRWGLQHIFLCDYVSGEPILNPESEEFEFQQQGGGTYEPAWLSPEELQDEKYPFKSSILGIEILEGMENGFPDSPKSWTLPAV